MPPHILIQVKLYKQGVIQVYRVFCMPPHILIQLKHRVSSGCPRGTQGVLHAPSHTPPGRTIHTGCPPGIQGVLHAVSHNHPFRAINTGCPPGIQGVLQVIGCSPGILDVLHAPSHTTQVKHTVCPPGIF